eukprot:TRINITY_DN63625_c0_g1_i1.p1 TRINITY_DN63625_c0_g1~~TRINITY_DN63625_c0_g1_i1.p1  ORF type:complete len:227 (+),score=28.69 TRINITY_DN63625_c0_g1_i1:126-806(+)
MYAGRPDDVVSVRSRASQASRRSSGSVSSSVRRAGGEVLRSSSVPQLTLPGAPGFVPGTAGHFDRHGGSRMTLAGPLHPPQAVEVGNYPCTGIPGYTGHIPGKYVENVWGASHGRANTLAMMAISRRGEPDMEDDFVAQRNPYGLCAKRRGSDIPGYTGHIPAKHATSVFGSTFANSNVTATQVRREQAVRRSHAHPLETSEGPLSWTGMCGAVKAAEAAQLGGWR